MKKVIDTHIIIVLMGVMGMIGCTSETVSNAKQENVLPHIYPDYIGVTIPVNIAPLCFSMAEETMVSTNRRMVSTNRQALLVDAVITDMEGIAIGVSTADCVPILIFDPRHHVAAAIHAGWRGTVQRIAEKAIDEMSRYYGTDGNDCKAVIGPSISMDSFEVGDEVYETFRSTGFNQEHLYMYRNWKWHIDLWECNRLQLLNKKIDAHNIHVAGICTYQSSDRFFSARKLGIQSGRLFSGIILR